MSAVRLNNSTTVQNKKDVSLGRENQSEKAMRTTLLKFVLLFSLVLLNTSLSTGQIQYNNIRFKQLSIAEGLPAQYDQCNHPGQPWVHLVWYTQRIVPI